jgi:hypothetical protein
MEKALAFVLCLYLPFLASCSGPTASAVTEVRDGAYKVVIRSQEFADSGIFNVDVCIADSSSNEFPTDKRQCVLHGFDFDQISAKWVPGDIVEISFDCGRVTEFSNHALVPFKTELPANSI